MNSRIEKKSRRINRKFKHINSQQQKRMRIRRKLKFNSEMH